MTAMDSTTGRPFQMLGDKLKALREQKQQTIPEVSGAVEIEAKTLEKIERGEQRPAEDILAVLISYFDIQEEEAMRLWRMAGYEETRTAASGNGAPTTTVELNQPIALNMPMDLRVVYTDMVHVMINDFGVIMNFMQTSGANNQPLAVARIGMSKDHARSVMEILDKSLKQSDKKRVPKMLKPAPKTTKKPDDKAS